MSKPKNGAAEELPVQEDENTEEGIAEITEIDTAVSKRAKAFVNYSIPLAPKDGKPQSLRSQKGFPIFQNPDFPNKTEDILVKLAESKGGTVEITMRCRIVLNQSAGAAEFDLDSIDLPDAAE